LFGFSELKRPFKHRVGMKCCTHVKLTARRRLDEIEEDSKGLRASARFLIASKKIEGRIEAGTGMSR
jgi:hypothetical protein